MCKDGRNPNQMLQLAERLSTLDPSKLEKDFPNLISADDLDMELLENYPDDEQEYLK